MDTLMSGARLLSKGMRSGNGALTFVGGLLVARGILRWLDGPAEELVYSRRLKPGERLEVAVTRMGD
jgi:hypothetical protein